MTQENVYSFGYGRCSKSEKIQAYTRFGQQQTVEAFVKSDLEPNGIQYAGFYFDPETSGDKHFLNRQAASTLNQRIRPGDHFVVAKLDRAFRNIADGFTTLEMLRKSGIIVHVLDYKIDTTTLCGEMMIGMGLLLAQWERRSTRERITIVFNRLKADGYPITGSAPIGWKKIGLKKESYYEVNLRERELAQRLIALKETFTYKQIGRDLHRHRITWRGHWKLSSRSVWKICQAAKKGFPLPGGLLVAGKANRAAP